MRFLVAVAEEAQHTQLPLETWAYGLIALIAFAALAVVVASYRNVANRHQSKANAYADAHGTEPSEH